MRYQELYSTRTYCTCSVFMQECSNVLYTYYIHITFNMYSFGKIGLQWENIAPSIARAGSTLRRSWARASAWGCRWRSRRPTPGAGGRALVPEEAARELRARRHRRVERRRPVLRGRPSLRQLCARHARLAVPVAHAAEQVAQRLRREAHLHGSWQQTVTFPIHVYTIKIAISLKMYFNLLIDIRVLSILDYANWKFHDMIIIGFLFFLSRT